MTDSLESARHALQSFARQDGGWRLPTIAELRGVFVDSCTRSEQDRSPFGALDGFPLWSSSMDGARMVWKLEPTGNNGRPKFYAEEAGAAVVIGVRNGKR